MKIIKTIIYSIVTVSLVFGLLEAAQRVRYWLRYNSSYWLQYGFATFPDNYTEMIATYMDQKKTDSRNVDVPIIRVFTQDLKGGYRKYNPSRKSVEFSTNSFGFRGSEFNKENDEGVCRIVALGGSTTFGTGVKDGFTYPEFLENSLNAKSDKKHEVINAGISSSTLYEIKNLFKHEIVFLNPDIIIINSLFNNLYYSDNAYKHHSGLLRKINRFVLAKSLFYMTLREKVCIMLNKDITDIYRSKREDIINAFSKDTIFWDNLKNNFEDICKIAKQYNIKVLIVKQPVWLREQQYASGMLVENAFEPVYKRAYALLDDLVIDGEVEIVNVNSYFDSAFPKEKFFLQDSIHLTEKGNEYMASLIAEKILFKK